MSSPEKQQRLANVYDTEVLPLFGARFGRLALQVLDLRPAASVLEVGCATGDLTVELCRRFDDDSHITALESSAPLADKAEAKLASQPAAARKVSLRTVPAPLFPALPVPDGEHDICVSNLAVADAPDPRQAVSELARVLKPGGQLVLTVPLRGTWAEFLDIYREVLRENDKHESLAALESYVAALPDGETGARWMEEAQLVDVEVAVERWELLFKSAREFFFAPIIDLGPLSRWKQIAGRGDQMQDVFFFAKEAIDAYFAGSVFSVTIVAGCLKGWKPIPTPQ
jgi:SAM-dependent methyltransferase